MIKCIKRSLQEIVQCKEKKFHPYKYINEVKLLWPIMLVMQNLDKLLFFFFNLALVLNNLIEYTKLNSLTQNSGIRNIHKASNQINPLSV